MKVWVRWVLLIGGGLIATTAYQAGLSQAVATAKDGTTNVVAHARISALCPG